MSGTTRRQLLQHALTLSAFGAVAAGCRPGTTGPVEPLGVDFQPGEALPWVNWAGNQACRPRARFAPTSEAELVDVLRSADGPMRPVGAGHSFTPLVPCDGALLATDRLNGVLATDDTRGTCEVWSGTRLFQLGPALRARGHALENLPDINYQTLAGATATSTHGTGTAYGSLSSLIEGLVIATPSGELIECDRERRPELFHAARCSLGALGIVSRLTLRTQKPFDLIERIHVAELEDVLANIDERASAVRHFELFPLPHSSLVLVQETDEWDGTPVETDEGAGDAEGLGALRDGYRTIGRVPWIGSWLYDRVLHGLADELGESVRTGPSYAVLTHDRLSRFREMEYTVPAEAGPDCLREILATIRERALPIVYPLEYRYVKRDDAWLSMFHERDGCSISVHQFHDEDHQPYFDAVEPIFWKYEGRPHWGKLHTLDAKRLAQLYPRWRDFVSVRDALDPEGKLLNAHLSRVFDRSA